MTWHDMTCHTIPYHSIPFHTIPYHTIPYDTTMSSFDEVTASLEAASLGPHYDANELADWFTVPGLSDRPSYVHLTLRRHESISFRIIRSKSSYLFLFLSHSLLSSHPVITITTNSVSIIMSVSTMTSTTITSLSMISFYPPTYPLPCLQWLRRTMGAT